MRTEKEVYDRLSTYEEILKFHIDQKNYLFAYLTEVRMSELHWMLKEKKVKK